MDGLRVRDWVELLVRFLHGRTAQEYQTAYMRAFETSENQLSSTHQTLDLDVLARAGDGEASLNRHLVERSVAYLSFDALQPLDGALSLLRLHLVDYLADDAGNRRPLPAASTVIRVHNSAVVAADLPWDVSLNLQTVRAAPAFHGRAAYDCVLVQMGEQDGAAREYAQLLLLFSARLPSASGDVGGWAPLAYVRWFKRLRGSKREHGALLEYGVVPLSSDRVDCAPITQEPGVRCSVVHLSAIKRRVHVMPAFQAGTADIVPNAFYVNPFAY